MHWLSDLLTVVAGWGLLIGFMRGLRCAIFHKPAPPKEPKP